MPGAGAALEDVPSSRYQLRIAVHRVVDREDEARARLLRHALHADVEPHRRVERGALVHEDVLELVAERRRPRRRRRSSRRGCPTSVIVSATRSITWRSDDSRSAVPSVPRKYFWATMFVAFCDHVDRELDVGLEEGVGAVLVVRDAGVAPLPLDRVVGMRRPASVKCRRIPMPICSGAIAMVRAPPPACGGRRVCSCRCSSLRAAVGRRPGTCPETTTCCGRRPRDREMGVNYSTVVPPVSTVPTDDVLVKAFAKFALVHGCTDARSRRPRLRGASGAVVFWSSTTSRSKSARSSKPL